MIHIYRSNAFGDVLWTEPVIRHFVSKNKPVNIITNYPEVFQNYPSPYLRVNSHISKWRRNILKGVSYIGLPKRIIKLDMAYEKSPQRHILEAYLDVAGISKENNLSLPQLFLTEGEKKRIIPEKYAVLHIDKNPLNYRNIYGVDWEKVVRYVSNDLGLKVVQISKSGENVFGEWHKTRDMRDVMSLIYNSSLFIGLDSGPSHIATSFEKPSAIFFGSVNPNFRHLDNHKKIFLQQPCEFAGCYHDVISSEGRECRISGIQGVPKCSLHTTDYVINALRQLSAEIE